MLAILNEVNEESFVIMDELGSGTDPVEGMGIAIAILEELRKSGALFLVTTHYPEVKEYANNTEHIINARMTFDKETLSPTYQMVIGEAGESCAFYIANRLGMSDEMLKTAIIASYGEETDYLYKFKKDVSSESGVDKEKRKNAKKITKLKSNRTNTDLSKKFKRGGRRIIS